MNGTVETAQDQSLAFPGSYRMNVFLIKMALVLIVALIVGGATYVVLTIIELLQKK